MSKMPNTNISNKDVNDAGVYNKGLSPSRCPVVRTHRPGHHQATVQKKCSTQDVCVVTCQYQSQSGVRVYRQRFDAFWKEKGLFQAGEQRSCDQVQVQMIQKKGWLPQLQLEDIRRLLESGENNVEAQKEEQNKTCTKPIKQVIEAQLNKIRRAKGEVKKMQNY